MVALGEWHNTRENQNLRINLVRNPNFPKKVNNIVVECGNALHQKTLERFIAGVGVPKEELQRVWRDITQSPVGGGDSPMCEEFLNEVRSINRNLPKNLRLRVLAGDPPIDWAKVKSLASLLDQSHLGSLFTVIRLGWTYPNTPRLESLMPNSRPAFLPFQGTPATALDANEFLGRGLPVKLFAVGLGLGQVADV